MSWRIIVVVGALLAVPALLLLRVRGAQACTAVATVEALEITQATQVDPREEGPTNPAVPLVQGRPTTVRAYVTSNCKNRIVSGRLRVDSGSSTTMRRAYNGPIIAPTSLANVERDSDDGTLNFYYIEKRTGAASKTVTFEVAACVYPIGGSGCVYPTQVTSETKAAAFTRQNLLDVRYVKIDHAYSGASAEEGGIPTETVKARVGDTMLWLVWPFSYPASVVRDFGDGRQGPGGHGQRPRQRYAAHAGFGGPLLVDQNESANY